jgi:hypothetical protein
LPDLWHSDTKESLHGSHANKSLDEAPGAPEGYRRSAKSWAG